MNRARSWFESVLPPLLILLAGCVVYSGSFHGEFILDDFDAIQNNHTIRRLWPLAEVLFPRHKMVTEGSTVEGRPLLNLSFALNYAAGGLNVTGYHAANLAIHLLNGLLVFGILRRTLLRTAFHDRMAGDGRQLAFLIALLWVIHPLQTESVTYIAQRAETLAGLFYLLTLYGFIRQLDSPHPHRWQTCALLSCAMGMGVKEVMVTAPLVVLFYDWMFGTGSWRGVWRMRWKFHLALMLLGWGALAAVMFGAHGSNLGNVKALLLQAGGTKDSVWAGHEVHWLDYARAQIWAVARYVRLCFWPSPLVFAYGRDIPGSFADLAPSALLLGLMLAGTVFACRRRHGVGFAGAWFFVILAPTSSVVPLSGQLAAEHRMYLPLAGIVAPVLLGGWLGWRRQANRWRDKPAGIRTFKWAGTSFVVAVLIMLGGLTMARNSQYKTALSIWQDTLSKWPSNASAHLNVGNALLDLGHLDESIASYERAMELKPDSADLHMNLGNALLRANRANDAMDQLEKAVELQPNRAATHINLGNFFLQQGESDQALAQYQLALEHEPGSADAHINLGNALLQTGRVDEAISHYHEVLAQHADDSAAWNNLGSALLRKGQRAEAIKCFRKTVQLAPNLADAQYNLGSALLSVGELDGAIIHLEKSVQCNANLVLAHNDLGSALVKKGKLREALTHYEKALAIYPDNPVALGNLAWLLSTSADESLRDGDRALKLAQSAIRFSPGNQPGLVHVLAAALAENGRFAEADETAERALSLALAQGDSSLAELIRIARRHYQAGEPLRDHTFAPDHASPVEP